MAHDLDQDDMSMMAKSMLPPETDVASVGKWGMERQWDGVKGDNRL